MIETKTIPMPTPQKYPCIVEYYDGSFLALFTSLNCGMVLTRNGLYQVGFYSKGWDETLFKKFEGTITLSNSK